MQPHGRNPKVWNLEWVFVSQFVWILETWKLQNRFDSNFTYTLRTVLWVLWTTKVYNFLQNAVLRPRATLPRLTIVRQKWKNDIYILLLFFRFVKMFHIHLLTPSFIVTLRLTWLHWKHSYTSFLLRKWKICLLLLLIVGENPLAFQPEF